jgi:predicted phage baseplate assembly protein
MSLAWTSLDDRQFQPLVDEMRKQIVRYCPEWTDYNISDPGITLIELFAWLTDLTLYRLNQVPIKNYVAFLDLLGVQPAPATSAQVELTFRLSAPFADPSAPLSTSIERHFPVSTRDLPGVDAPFTTVEALKIVTPTIKQIYAGLQDPLPVTQLLEGFKGRPFYAFAANPGYGDEETEELMEGACFCIGLEAASPLSGTLAGHILQITFESDPTKAKGQSNNDPPLVWECWIKEGQRAKWQIFDADQTELEQGIIHIFSQKQASMIFYLPQNLYWDDPVTSGVKAYWVRCCFRRTNQSQKPYTASPRILGIRTAVFGASVLARHASFVHKEVLGQSDGAAGQSFTLQQVPVLAWTPAKRLKWKRVSLPAHPMQRRNTTPGSASSPLPTRRAMIATIAWTRAAVK